MDSSTRTETDDASQKFAEAYSTLATARAAEAAWEAATDSTDEAITASNAMMDEATRIFLAIPAATSWQLLKKFQVVDALVTKEWTDGRSAANWPAIGMASLKMDLMNLTEIMEATEIPA